MTTREDFDNWVSYEASRFQSRPQPDLSSEVRAVLEAATAVSAIWYLGGHEQATFDKAWGTLTAAVRAWRAAGVLSQESPQ